MSYSFERTYTVALMCWRCKKKLQRSESDEVYAGALYGCPYCNYKVHIIEVE